MRYVALVRAVNVGGRKLTVDAMRSVFEGLGFDDVVTYLQTGNVCFTSALAPARAIRAIESAISGDAGLDVRVLLRTKAELDEIVAANPLFREARELKTLHVTFLEGHVDAGLALDRAAYLPDQYELGRREVYLFCPTGYGRTKLNNTFWERRLKMVATTRNWRTVTELVRLA